MTLRQLADMIPATTPIRIYRENNPYEPLVSLIYSDTLRKSGLDITTDTVTTIGAAVHDGLAYLIIWLQHSESEQ